jgi:hypothetical protein
VGGINSGKTVNFPIKEQVQARSWRLAAVEWEIAAQADTQIAQLRVFGGVSSTVWTTGPFLVGTIPVKGSKTFEPGVTLWRDATDVTSNIGSLGCICYTSQQNTDTIVYVVRFIVDVRPETMTVPCP